MNLFRTPSPRLLALALALAALCPWTPLSLSLAPADAQIRTKSHAGLNAFKGRSSFNSRHRSSGFHGFSRSGHRTFGRSNSRGSFSHSGFGRSFSRSNSRGSFSHSGFGRSFSSVFHHPRTVIIQRSVTPQFTTSPDVITPSLPSYPVAAGPTARDAWTHLSAGRNTQAQQIFGLLAGANPADAAPKVGYGLAALLRGDHTNAERALIRAHQANPAIWQTLNQQPEARAAALDLLQRPYVQASETLRTAMGLLAQASASAPNAEHDYGIDATTP